MGYTYFFRLALKNGELCWPVVGVGDRPRRSGSEASPLTPVASKRFFHSAPRSVAGAMRPLHSGELRTLRKTSLLLSRWPEEPWKV